jgi:hypothetical protein
MGAINATGIWTEVNYGQKSVYATGKPEELKIDKKDREILRKLASKVLSVSLKESTEEKRKFWYGHNALRLKKPLIFYDPKYE